MATKKRKIGAVIALDGEEQFRKSVTECNKVLTTMKSEMKLVSAETTGSANTLDTLKKKHDTLQKVLDASVAKEEAIQKALDHAQGEYDKVGSQLDDYKKKLAAAKKSLEEMEDSQDSSSEAIEAQKKVVADLSENVKSAEMVYSRAGSRVQDWETKLNGAKTETIKVTAALKENDTYMDEAASSADKCATSIDEFGNKAQKVKTDVTDLGNIIKVNLVNTLVDTGKEFAKDTFESAISGANDLETAVSNLAASTGNSKESMSQYSDIIKELYSDNYGDSMEELADTTAKVMQYTNQTDPDIIKNLVQNAEALDDTFGIDINESLRAAQTLMDNFGVTAEDAYNLMATGAQNGLNKSDELADNIAEYGSLWSQAGFSAKDMFSIMENGLSSGAYNLDKVNDFVKEFGNSLADGRVEDQLSNFSSETQNLFREWKNGQASTKDVFQSVIKDLSSMTNQQEALTIASDTWSSLGEDNSLKVITSLNNVNDAYEDVEGTMEDICDIKYDTVATQWESLGRTFQTEIAAPIAEKFFPVAEEGMKMIAENLDTLIPIVAGVGTAFGVEKIVTGVMSITIAITGAVTATEGATIVFTVFNAVISANPAAAIAIGIGALATAAIALSGNAQVAKTATQELADAAKEVNTSALNAADELDAATDNISSTIDGSEVSADTAYRLVDELEELASKSNKTATEQAKMKTIVGELNTMFPDMELAIDDTTGALNMSKDAIDEYVKSAVTIGKIEAIQKAVKETTEKLVEAEIERSKQEEKLGETEDALETIERKRADAAQAVTDKNDALKEAQEKYNEACKTGAENIDELYAATQDTSEATIEYNGKVVTVTEALKQMADDEQALKDTHEEQSVALETVKTSIENAEGQINTYSEYLEKNTEDTKSNKDALDENTESTKTNTDAKVSQSEALQASIEVAGQELEAYNNLSTAQQTMATDVTNAVLTMQESVQSSLESQMDMFEAFDYGTKVSTDTLLENMQSQVTGVEKWEQQLAALAEKGIDQDLLQSLADMGPDGINYVSAFNEMTAEELEKANGLWAESVKIKDLGNKWGKELTQSVGELAADQGKAWDDLAKSMNMSANKSGEYVVQGLVDGMQNAQKQATAEGKTLGVETVDSVDDGAGVASPSKKTMQSGKYIVEGLINGIKDKATDAKKQAKDLGTDTADAVKDGLKSRENAVSNEATTIAKGITDALSKGLENGKYTVTTAAGTLANNATTALSRYTDTNSAYNCGYNLAIGMANGINRGQSSVINSVSSMCAAAVRQARSSLRINSPSKVFQEIGSYAAQGFPVGFTGETSKIEKSVAGAMNSISAAAIGGIDFSTGYSGNKNTGGTSVGTGGEITLQIPVYMNGVLTQTEVEKISLNAWNKTTKRYNSAKGVKSFAVV